jgi:tetratricopeptide (TPR) repeat protein
MGQKKKSAPLGRGINVAGDVSATGDIVGGDKITNVRIEALPENLLSLHQLPIPPGDFTGRDLEFAELKENCEDDGASLIGLSGMGGVGKTALALKLAENIKSRYPDAQFYIDLRGFGMHPLTVSDAMKHIVRAYHSSARLPDDEMELNSLYRSVLHGKRALLFLDNAVDESQVAELIPPTGCLLLFTSRMHFALPGSYEKNLDELRSTDAVDLLLRIAPRLRNEAEDEVHELARICGYLPLSLRAVGSALRVRPNLTLGHLLLRLKDVEDRLKLTGIETAIQTSYDLLPEKLRERFRLLAVFPNSFYITGAMAVWELDQHNSIDCLGDLLASSLLNFDETSERYSLHNLVNAFASRQMSRDELLAAQLKHSQHYCAVILAAEGLYFDEGDSSHRAFLLLDMEWSNIQTGHAWAAANVFNSSDAAELCIDYPDNGLSCLQYRLGAKERIAWFEMELAVSQRLGRTAHEASALGNLGTAYSDLSDLSRAIQYYRRSLNIVRKLDDPAVEAATLANLGNAFGELGNYRRAITFHKIRLDLARRLDDQSGQSSALAALGHWYRRMEDFDTALGYLEAARALGKSTQNRLVQGQDSGNLGQLLLDMGDYARAIPNLVETLEIMREYGDRHGECLAMGGIGRGYYSLEDYPKALEFLHEALEIAQGEGDRSQEAELLFSLALTSYAIKDREGAIAQAEAARLLFQEIGSREAVTVQDQLGQWRA